MRNNKAVSENVVARVVRFEILSKCSFSPKYSPSDNNAIWKSKKYRRTCILDDLQLKLMI